MKAQELEQIAQTVANKVGQFVERTLGRKLEIRYLTIFAHTPGEYAQLIETARELGKGSEANNGEKFELAKPLQTEYGNVRMLRIRTPDVYRSQLGCADFSVEDYEAFKAEELPRHPDSMRLIERSQYEMIEFFSYEPNDVLAYVVSKPIS